MPFPAKETNRLSTPANYIPAKALIAWMDEARACLLLAGQNADHAANPAYRDTAANARSALTGKAAVSTNAAAALQSIPGELHSYTAELLKSKMAQDFDRDGFELKLVDLRKVIAAQEYVFVGPSAAEVKAPAPGNLAAIAALTLPLPQKTSLPAQYDVEQKAWIISLNNPNLRIVGNWGGPVENGMLAFGFAVAVMPSLMNVGIVGDRCVLRDGYHRALALLRAGIHQAPLFVKRFNNYDELLLGRLGLLPVKVLSGQKPPLLTDYLAKDVAREVLIPEKKKMVVIHGMELSTVG